MSAGTDDVKRTAALARLAVTEAEARRLGPQFERILEAFRVLEGLDLGQAQAMARGGDVAGPLRPDEPRPSLPPERVLADAPERVEDFYSVPKTVGSSGPGRKGGKA